MVELSEVSLGYGGQAVLSKISLHLEAGTGHAMMGASASGKSSLLRAILRANLRPEMAGRRERLWCNGRITVAGGTTIGYAPQEACLAPWLDVRGNIVLGLRLAGASVDPDVLDRCSDLIHGLLLGSHTRRYPHQLSTGTSKRVALARALALESDLLLLDEPFAGFDFDVRERAIGMINGREGAGRRTTLMITHEPYEAAALCDTAHIISLPPDISLRTVERRGQSVQAFTEAIRAELKRALGMGAVGP
jgi:ABC-type nitrate/sulfonate/bicarbonate transport system ATPase subunit